jgi:hypothetical protein
MLLRLRTGRGPVGPWLGLCRRRVRAGHLGTRAQMPSLPGRARGPLDRPGLTLAEATYLRWLLLSLNGVLICYVAWKRIGPWIVGL